MGEDVQVTGFTREDRRRYRDKVRRSLDVFARLLAEARFDAERRSFGMEIELNLTDARGDPAPHNAAVLELDRRRRLPDRARRFNVEINVPPRLLGGTVLTELEQDVRASLNRAEEQLARRGAHMMLVGHPADRWARAPRRGRASAPTRATPPQRADLRRARGGPRARIDGVERLRGGRRHDRPRGGLHQRPAPPAGRAGGLRRALERRPGDRRRPARARGQLAVPLRPRALARDAHRALRAGHGHAPRGAQGPGGAPARVVRRALDHLDLRPLRGERPLLPGAAADVRRRGPRGGARRRRRAEARRAAAAQRHGLPLEPARLRRRPTAPAPAGREPRAARRARRWWTSWPTPPSTTGSSRRSPTRSGRSGRRCPSPPRRRTSTPAPATASTRALYWPGARRGPGDRARAAPAAADGPRGPGRAGRRRRRPRPPAGIIEQRCLTGRNGATWQVETVPPPAATSGAWSHARRCAR